MLSAEELLTERLRMRRWCGADRAPLAALNADPRVMQYFPTTLSSAESDCLLERIEAHFEEHGYGLWALESRASGELLGYTGLEVVGFQAHFTPAVEVGWRLAYVHWGRGYASEAALAALGFGFEAAGLPEIVSTTATVNQRSRAVMERIGMNRDPGDDFDHPLLDASSPLCKHVLFRLSAREWSARGARN